MKQTAAKQYAKIRPFLPVQRGNVRIPNIAIINAVLYVLENGCKRRALPESWAEPVAGAPLAMDRACEGDETRQLVRDLGMTPVVPPKANRKAGRDCDRKTCKLRNEIERLLRRFKGCRRLFTRFDKLDATYRGFLNLAAVFEMTHDLA